MFEEGEVEFPAQAMNLLPWVPGAVREYLQGVQDALNPYWTVAFVARSATIRKATVRCVALNGVLFLGSIFLLHRGLLPLIHFFGHSVLHLADRGSGTDRVESLGPIGRFVDAVVFLFYQMFWIVPLYCISLLMNTIWYGKISNAAYELRHRTKADLGIAVAIKENIYRALLVFFFIAETSAAYLFVPLAGPAVSLVLVCWINALYSFECAWAMQGMDLERRLAFIELRWPYFLGFGTPVALASSFWSTFVGLAVFSLCFPSCIIQATCSEYSRPKEVVRAQRGPQPPRLPIFRLSMRCTDWVLRRLNSLATAGGRKRR